jgi:hypothetical protein
MINQRRRRWQIRPKKCCIYSEFKVLGIRINAPDSSLNVTEHGLVLLKCLRVDGEIPCFDGGVVNPVSNQSFLSSLDDKILDSESLLVQHLTPYLRDAVSSHRGERDLVLLNTERHLYLKSTVVDGNDTGPDMLVCHRAAVEEDKSDVDKKYDSSDKDFLFGKLANWNLRDTVTCL